MRFFHKLWFQLGVVLVLMSVALAASGTLTVKDGNGVLRTLGITTDGSGNYYSNQAIVDGTNAANKATVTAAGALQVDNSAVTQPVSGTITANAGSGTFNVNCTSGCAGNGSVSNTGSAVPAQATFLGANNGGNLTGLTSTANGLKVDGSAVTQPVSLASLPALASGGNTIGAVTQASGPWTSNITQVGSASLALGQTTMSASIPVAIASNQSAVSTSASQSGTWTVQPGNTPNTTPWLVTTIPATGNGWTPFLANALSTTVKSIKASAGELGGYYCWNPNTTVEYVQIFDAASVTLGTTTPKWSIGIPPGSAANLELSQGIHFATAIQAAATTTATGSSAPTTALDCNFAFN